MGFLVNNNIIEENMEVYRTIKIRIYPNKHQEEIIEETFNCCQKLWNIILGELIEYHKVNKSVKKVNIKEYLREFPTFQKVDILALYSVQFELEHAFRQSLSTGSYPQFKSRNARSKSFTTTNKFGGLEVSKDFIAIKNIGKVKAKISQKIEYVSKVTSVEVRKQTDGKYYVCLTTTKEIKNMSIKPIKILGLDYKADGLYLDSEGNIGTNHRYFRQSEKKIAKIQRGLDKKCGGIKGKENSNNYNKQLKKLDKAYTKIKNQRKDNLHKISTYLADKYDAIAVEDISMKQIVQDKKYHLGKSTYDNGYYYFLRMLEYKLKERGKMLIKINRYYPSTKKCSSCGKIKNMNLDERIYECPSCGLKIDRDLNAAINIKKEGERILKTCSI